MTPANYTLLELYEYRPNAANMLHLLKTGDALAEKLEKAAERLRQHEARGDLEAFTFRVRLTRAIEYWERERNDRLENLKGGGIIRLYKLCDDMWFSHQEEKLLKPLAQAGRLLKRLDRAHERGNK